MRITAFIWLILALGLALPALAQEPKKPATESKSMSSMVGGKTLEEWIAEIPSKDRSQGEAALRAILMFGPELAQRGAPAMLKELKKHSPNYPIDTSMRTNLVIALGEILGAEQYADPKVVAEAVPVLARLLRDGQAIIRYRAGQALGKIGTPAASSFVLSELMTLSRESFTHENRNVAVFALGRVGMDRKKGPDLKVLGAIYERLRKDASSSVRLSAIQALTYLGPPVQEKDRKDLENVLEEVAAKDHETAVRIWAHMSIISIHGKADPTRVSIIGKLLSSREPTTRSQAAQALLILGLEAKSQIPALVSALEDEDKSVAALSMMALGRMGRWADPALPRLQQIAMNAEWPEVLRVLAGQAIDGIKGKTAEKEKEKEKK